MFWEKIEKNNAVLFIFYSALLPLGRLVRKSGKNNADLFFSHLFKRVSKGEEYDMLVLRGQVYYDERGMTPLTRSPFLGINLDYIFLEKRKAASKREQR